MNDTKRLPMTRGTLGRRHILKMSAVVGALGAVSPFKCVLAQSVLRRTQDQIMGPFYPVMKTPDRSGDLTRVNGSAGRAKGQVLNVTGRVVNPAGEPVRDARVEIWQANAAGRYAHPDDPNPAPLDPNFEGFGVVTTDAEGRYRFKTIKPAAYPTGPTSSAAGPHSLRGCGAPRRAGYANVFRGRPVQRERPLPAECSPTGGVDC